MSFKTFIIVISTVIIVFVGTSIYLVQHAKRIQGQRTAEELANYRASQTWPDENGYYLVLPGDDPSAWPRDLGPIERETLQVGASLRVNPTDAPN